MEGMSNKSAEELIPLAKSGCTIQGYDRAQRADLLTATKSTISVLAKASKESPVVNPAFVIKNWGKSDVELKVDGKKIKRGKDFRFGHRRTLEGTDLIVWFKAESEKPLKVTISSAGK